MSPSSCNIPLRPSSFTGNQNAKKLSRTPRGRLGQRDAHAGACRGGARMRTQVHAEVAQATRLETHRENRKPQGEKNNAHPQTSVPTSTTGTHSSTTCDSALNPLVWGPLRELWGPCTQLKAIHKGLLGNMTHELSSRAQRDSFTTMATNAL